MQASNQAPQALEAEPVATDLPAPSDQDVEMTEEAGVKTALVSTSTDSVEAVVTKKTNISVILTAAAKAAASLGTAASASTTVEQKRRRSPVKVVQAPMLKRLKKREALRIDCPITKYPAAVRMQSVESFLLDVEE